jgi:hypothetical protein
MRLPLLRMILMGSIIVDLFYFGMNLNPVIEMDFYTSLPKSLKVVKGGMDRVMVSPKTNEYYRHLHGKTLKEGLNRAKEVLIPNLGLRYNLFEIGGYTSLKLMDYEKFKNRLWSISFDDARPLLSLVSMRYLITQFEINEEGIKKIYDDGVMVYENLNPLPRAFLVQKAVFVKDRERILERLFSPGFDPRKEILIEG